ncbi:MAG: endonuclease MutS2 [Bacteroidales bacterium]|nr:endonuclease MutS2 [Bacteroidales bacterium]
MMIYPSNYEKKIGFDSIRNLIKECCISSLGCKKVDAIELHTHVDIITRLHEQTEEFRQILLFETSFPAQNYIDTRSELTRIQIEGTYIDLEPFCELRAVLKTIQACLLFFRVKKEEEKYPYLQQLTEGVTVDNELIKTMDLLVDDKGNVKSNASPDLQTIRQKIVGIENEVQKQLRKLVHQAKKDELMEATAEVTVREGRLVIPVPAAHKRRLKGFIHDESATGQTVYIEPQEVFELNNNLRNLKSDEKREVIRILTLFTNELREHIPSLNHAFEFLGQIDCIRAKAKFALSIHAIKPIIVDKQLIKWQKAKHPLLYLNFQQQKKEVVPLTVEINKDSRILIISGPNAGGKSVCLKTVALLQYMFQCGLLIPASELSEFGIFYKFFLDIGDDQSIENDLSTYSFRLKNMNALLQEADESTLFLMDELGSGTDPQYGGAIAETLLEILSNRKAFGVVTTHFGNLKAMANQTDGLVNAAMLFDEEEMKPLFTLKIGKWGSSFTFEIARKIGLSENLLQTAIEKIGTTQIDYEFLLQKLEREKIELENQKKMSEAVDGQLKELIDKYENLKTNLETQKFNILKEAKKEAQDMLNTTNKLIEKTIKDIKESKADKELVKQTKEGIKTFHKALEKKLPTPPKQPIKKAIQQEDNRIKEMDYVVINEINTVGQVTFIDGEDVVVSFNSINLKTTIDKVRKTKNIKKETKSNTPQYGGKNIYTEINKKSTSFKLELDIRGMRADEATEIVERYIDDAILLRIHEVKIIHGKGSGILRSITRDILAKNIHIQEYYDEKLEWGGAGKTIVKIK